MISSSPPIRPPWSAADSSGFSLSWSSVLPSSSSQSATWDLGALVGTLRWAYVRWMGICEVVNKDIVGTEQGTTQVTSCRNPTGLASGAVIYLVGVTIPFLVLLLSHLSLEVFFIWKKARALSWRNWNAQLQKVHGSLILTAIITLPTRFDGNTCDDNYMIYFQKYTQKNQTMVVVLSLAYAIFLLPSSFPLFPVELGVQVGVYLQSIQFSRMTTFADWCVLVPGLLFLVLVDVRRQCVHIHDHRPRVSGRVPAISQGCHWLFQRLTGGFSVACKVPFGYWI